MPLITWSDEYSTKVSSIDEQHKQLINLINQLQEALTVGKGKDALGKVLIGLIDYTKMHFAHEEKLMQQHQYAESAAHRKMHDDLVKQVGELNQKFQAGGAFLSTEVMNFLKKWLTDHINNTDKKFGAFLNTKGVK